jgi:hypothetical protein
MLTQPTVIAGELWFKFLVFAETFQGNLNLESDANAVRTRA